MDFRFQGLRGGFPVSLALAAIAVASTSQAQVLTEREAYDQIVRAIAEQLSRPERFTRLSHNISALSAAPARQPLISILAGSSPQEFTSDAANKAYLKDEGLFLVTRYGSVVATIRDQIMLQGQGDRWGKKFVIWSPTSFRRLAYPDYPGISQVFWTGTDWGFVMGDGIKLDSSTNFQAALPGRFQKSLVIETQSQTSVKLQF